MVFNQPELSTSTSQIANPGRGIDDALAEFVGTALSGDRVYLCFYSSTTRKVTDAFNAAALVVGDSNIFHITEKGTSDSQIYAFPNFLHDGSATINSEYPLMHNKFAVVINTASQTGRVWTGSYNPNETGTLNHNENAVWIESYELARIYESEFLHMWNGGTGRFSTDKTLSTNTARTVYLGDGTRVDAYFAPYTGSMLTDTRRVVMNLIDNARYSVFFNMYTLGVSERGMIMGSLMNAHDRGVEIKGVVEAAKSSTAQGELREYGLDILLDSNPNLLHHKFCVIDYGSENPHVITGSANWTDSGSRENDENFLVIYSRSAAELFWEEFHKNYSLAGGGLAATGDPAVGDLLIYPSPARGTEITIGFTLSHSVTDVRVGIYTLSGENVIELEPSFHPGTYNETRWELKTGGSGVASGLYFVKVEAETGDGRFFEIEKFTVIR